MKKFTEILLASILACGLHSSGTMTLNAEAASSLQNEVKEESVWVMEPCIKAEKVNELFTKVVMISFVYNLEGAPVTFMNQDKYGLSAYYREHPEMFKFEMNPEMPFSADQPGRQYRTDVLTLVIDDSHMAVFDYDGNQLIDGVFDNEPICSSLAGSLYQHSYGSAGRAEELVCSFSEDFRSTEKLYVSSGYGDGDAPMYFVYNGRIGSYSSEDFEYDDNLTGKHVIVKAGFTEQLPDPDFPLYAVPIRTDPEDYTESGCAVVRNGIIKEYPGTLLAHDGHSFVNGFLKVTDYDPRFDPERHTESGIPKETEDSRQPRYTFIDAAKETIITDFIYDEAKVFEDGFCPVRKGDKWGYIDQTGKEVTDFLFDDASVSCDGKVWVSVNGKYGVLNLKKAAGKKIPMNFTAKEKKIDTSRSAVRPLGEVTVAGDNVNIQSYPRFSQETITGRAKKGKTYTVSEVSNDDTLWYKIGDRQWITDSDGKSLRFKPID